MRRTSVLFNLLCPKCMDNIANILDNRTKGHSAQMIWVDNSKSFQHVYLYHDEEEHTK